MNAASTVYPENKPSHQLMLARHDLYWSQPPKTWDDCAFLGNGMLGTEIYSAEHKSKRQVYRHVMGRVDVTAQRERAFAARVPVGEFELEFDNWIYGGTTAKLDLWNAEFVSDVITTGGHAKIRSLIHSLHDVLIVETETDENESTSLKWYPYPKVSHALLVDDGRPNVDQYMPQITMEDTVIDGVDVHFQIYNASADGCTAACLAVPCGERHTIYYATVLNGHSEKIGKAAVTLLKEAASVPLNEYLSTHRAWWHDYYRQSYVSLPDTRIEGFYWIQMYKLASAARANTPPMDNQGPWTGPTPWPGTWFNMNIQLAYAPVYTSNHLEIGASLCNALDKNFQNLIHNVPPEYRMDSAAIGRSMSHDFLSPVEDEKGNLVWICHNYYRQYRYSMNDIMLREHLYPLLRRGMNYYFHLLKKGADGKLHLPPTISPEYGSFKKLKVDDCNYDLFLMRWGIQTLLSICTRLHIEDEQQELWRTIYNDLPDYPVDETGFLIGKDIRMEHGHRHYSHLLGVYPLHIVDCNKPENRALVRTSLRHWFGMEGDLRGFTFAGAASIAATLGDGNEALRYVMSGLELFKPNTFYREAGPVIESPLGVAEALQDMLLQSYGGELRVFPAMPDVWQDASFYHLRAEGAFLVSAQRQAGKTVFIRIKSLAGEPLVLHCEWQGDVHAVYNDGYEERISSSNGQYRITLKTGKEVLVRQNTSASFLLQPVPEKKQLCNYWGSFKPWRRYGIPF